MRSPMMKGGARWASGVAAAIGALATPAWGQDMQLTGSLAGAPVARSRGAARSPRIVMPSGHLEVAGETAFLMSQASPRVERLALTDLALFRLNLRRSFADWFELYGGVGLLPKQPTRTNASLLQVVHVGAQAQMATSFGASLGAAAGPLLGADGAYYRAGPGLSFKPAVSDYLRFLLGIGNAWTILDYRDASRAFWLGEVVTHAETQIGDSNASMWVGMDYAVPFVARPRAAAPDPAHGYLDPQVRLNVEIGGALSLHADGWDVYATYTIVDRGELDKPETTLPILDGGFDQQQIAIGVEYRFEPKRQPAEPAC